MSNRRVLQAHLDNLGIVGEFFDEPGDEALVDGVILTLDLPYRPLYAKWQCPECGRAMFIGPVHDIEEFGFVQRLLDHEKAKHECIYDSYPGSKIYQPGPWTVVHVFDWSQAIRALEEEESA